MRSHPLCGLRAVLVLLVGLSGVLTAEPAAGQCSDPQPDGQTIEFVDLPVTLTDGYVTRMDVRAPAVAPGPCGWPTLLIIHSNRGNKERVADAAEQWAKRGYVAVTFDVRGQGPSMALNNPNVYGRGALGIRERLDLFEVLEKAESLFPVLIDFDRLGVTGPTQGGLFAWCAAAHSGRVPPPNPWRTAPLPEIAAVAVHDFDLDMWQWLVPDGTNVTEMFIWNVFGDEPGLNVEPAYRALVEPFVLAEDYAGLRAAVDLPQESLPALLQSSDVPLLVSLSYDDMFGAATRTYEDWQQLSPGADKLLNLTTGGHRTPKNTRERELRKHRETLWFDHHLRGIDNGVDALDEFRFAILPAERPRVHDEDYLWDAQEEDVYPPAAASPQRLYLGGGGKLVDTAGQAGNGQDAFSSNNPSGYDIADYVVDLPSAEEMVQKIPLEGVEYDSPPLLEDLPLAGAPVAHLEVRSSDEDFLIHVALLDVRPSGVTRYINGGFRTVRGHPGGTVTLDVPIAVYGYRVKKGHKLRLRVENLAWHRAPMRTETGPFQTPSFLRALPVFTDFTVRVQRGGDSYVDLPVATPDPVRVGTSVAKVDGDNLQNLRAVVYTDSERRNWSFQVLAGISGSTPGIPWSGIVIPVNLDNVAATILGLGPSPPRPELRGTLDEEGRAEVTLALSALSQLPPAALGVTVAGIAFDGQGNAVVSEPLDLLSD